MAKKKQTSSSRGGGGSNPKKKKKTTTNNNNRSPPQPKFVHCPYTNQKVFIQRATLKDLKSKSTYDNSTTNKKKRLWLLTSPAQRMDITTKAAQAIANIEQTLLPSLGGRSWEVTCKVSDHSSILFRTWKGRMELATLPHIIDKIPQPPVWPGRRRDTPDEYYDIYENLEAEDEEQYCRGLQEREISTLSQVAWDIKSQGYPTPTVTLKWKSPDYQTFTSRKSAWEYATQMAKNEVMIHKHILGIGASGKLLQPTPCSAPTALKVGKLRFDRDGLWVIGQELSWQEDRIDELQEQAEEDALAKAEAGIGSDSEENKKPRPPTGLSLYLKANREEYRLKHSETCSTLHQATRELRQVWKTLSEEEHDVWNLKANPNYIVKKNNEKDDDGDEDVGDMSNDNTDNNEEPTSNNEKKEEPEDLLPPPPVNKKRRISTSTFFIKSQRKEYHSKRCLERGSRFTMSSADTELREIWKNMNPIEQVEWKMKFDQYEIDEAKKKQQEEASKAKAEAESMANTATAASAGSKVEQVEFASSSSSSPFPTATSSTGDANPTMEGTTGSNVNNITTGGESSSSSLRAQPTAVPATSSSDQTATTNKSPQPSNKTLLFEEEKKEDDGTKDDKLDGDDDIKNDAAGATASMVVEENKETTKATALEISSSKTSSDGIETSPSPAEKAVAHTPEQEEDEIKMEVCPPSANTMEVTGATTSAVARATPSPETADTMMEESNEANNSEASQPSSSMPAANNAQETIVLSQQEGKDFVLEDHKEPKPAASKTAAAKDAAAIVAAPVPSSEKMKKKSTANKKSPPPSAASSKSNRFKPTAQATKRWCLNTYQIDLCYHACMEHYEQVMRTVKARDLHRELEDGFDVLRERGRGRYDMELPAFDNSEFFDFLTDLQKAPWMPVVRTILGDDVVLIHKGCFLSMPGAEIQEYHQDGVHLTTQTQRPCHAINVFVPLVDLTTRNGPTEFTLGSHVLGHEDYDKDFVETPKPKAGTPVIFDYRLGHRGMGNSSQSCRPIVYCTYARGDSDGKTFSDSVNFSRKRYHKIGELTEKPLSREERRNNRKRSIEQREEEAQLKRILEEQEEAAKQKEGGDEPMSLDGGAVEESRPTLVEANVDNDSRAPSGGASTEDTPAEQQQPHGENAVQVETDGAAVASGVGGTSQVDAGASSTSWMLEGHVTYRSGPM